MTIADRINRMMRAKGLRQVDLADMAGFSRQYIDQVCRGKYPRMAATTVQTLVAAMGGTMAEFFEDEGE